MVNAKPKGDLIQLIEFEAAEEVAGSKLLMKVGGLNVLIDMGLTYKRGEEKEPIPFINHPNGVKPKDIDCVVLTHGHADHMGQLLKLYKAGFRGEIFSTEETFDICKMQLTQAVSSPYIHNRWAKGKRFKTGSNKGKFLPFKAIIYNNQDLKSVLNLFENFGEKAGFPYEKTISIAKNKNTNVKATFYEAGHIPGSAQILLDITHKRKKKKILTAFDLGRTDYRIAKHPVADIPIVRFPHTDFPKDIDAVVIEATYGNKVHAPFSDSLDAYLEAMNYTSKKRGQIVVPLFSIMRYQMVDCITFGFEKQKKLPDNIRFIGSCPTGDKAWRLFMKYPENFDKKTSKLFEDAENNPYKFARMERHKKIQETLEVIKSKEPAAIFASSGMGSWGRAKTFLRETISNPKNAVMGTGYAAPGTVMWYIKEGQKSVPFGNEIGDVPLKAKYFRMRGLSGHADFLENIAHVRNIYNPRKEKNQRPPLEIFIKHGEKENCQHQRKGLIEKGRHNPDNVHVMKKGVAYELYF